MTRVADMDLDDKRAKSSPADRLPKLSDESPAEQVEAAFTQHKGKELEDRLRDFFWLKRQQWFQQSSKLFTQWRRQWDLYLNRSRMQRFVRGNGIQVYVPRALILTETLAPRFGKAVFGGDRWMSCEAMNRYDPDGEARMEATMYSYAEDGKWQVRGYDWIKLSLIHGASILLVRHNRRKVRVPVREGVEEDVTDSAGRKSGTKVRLKDVRLEDRVEEEITWRVLPPHSYFQDLKEGDPQRLSGGAGHEELICYDELKELEEDDACYGIDRLLVGLKSSTDNPKSLPGLRPAAGGYFFGWDQAWWTWEYTQARDIAAGVHSDYGWRTVDQKGNWEFVVQQFQAPVPLDGWNKPFVWCSVWMVGPFVIRCIENDNPLGRTDYHKITAIPVPGYLYGQSIITINESLIVEENEHRNLLLDASSLRVRPVTLVERGMNLAADTSLHMPGQRLDVAYKGGIDWMPPPPSMQESEMQVGVLDGLMRSAAGVPYSMEGQSASGRQTAGEVSTMQFEGNIRHSWAGDVMQLDGVKGVLDHSLALIQMHMTQKRAVRLLGMHGWEWKEVSPEEIMGQYTMRMRTSTETANMGLGIQHAQNFANLASNLAQLSPEIAQRTNWIEVLKSVSEMMRTPGRERWFKERKSSANTFWREIAALREGIKPDTSDEDDAVTFMAYVSMPGPVDPATGQPGMSIRDEFLAADDIDPANKALFEAFVRERADIATQQMLQNGMPGMPGQMPPPGQPGASPPSGAGGSQAGGGFPGTPPQEQPRSMEAISRMQGNLPASTPMHKQRFNGMQ